MGNCRCIYTQGEDGRLYIECDSCKRIKKRKNMSDTNKDYEKKAKTFQILIEHLLSHTRDDIKRILDSLYVFFGIN